MDFLISLLISKYLWWIVAILVTILTIWITSSAIQLKIALGVPINIFVKALWVATIILWLIVLVRGFLEFVSKDIKAQVILFILIAGILYFAGSENKSTKSTKAKRGTKR
jgi:hypothetical protein